jgi:ATP-dependent Clp protease ATP-binding subunit ClpA
LRDPHIDLATLPQLVSRVASLMTLRLRESVKLGDTAPTVETKHLLVGILDEGHTLAVKVLQTIDIDIDTDELRAAATAVAVEEGASSAPEDATTLGRPSPQGRAAFASALEAAIDLGHNYLGTEHLPLGLLDTEGGAATVLRAFGVEADSTRRALVSALAGFGHARENDTAGSEAASLADVVERLDQIERRVASLGT